MKQKHSVDAHFLDRVVAPKLRRQDIRVKFLADPGPDVKRNYPRVNSSGVFSRQPLQWSGVFASFSILLRAIVVCLAQVPCRTWAITPDDPEAMNPPCKEDLDQRSVDFHPMVTMHLFRP